MANSYKKTKAPTSSFPLNELEKMHPYKMLLLIGIFGSILIFFFLLMVYTASGTLVDKTAKIEFPKAFVISTLILFGSSFTISRAIEYFEKEKTKQLKKSLLFTLALAFAFSFSQFFGWNELMNQEASNAVRGAIVYLYALSGLHILHMSAGIIYLAYCYVLLIRKLSNPVHSLLYFTNPFRKLQLGLLVTYWHFMDGLWMFLFLFFLFFL
ncbi:MAG: cytochrome c oxidase subunit 3 [Imperialibacter sp.]|uniref:cytochrome c oxidase subunit 3 n=1 Tax=Imperialibacter sp. TaxID=2038411 RepID=UPI0032EF8FF7